MACSCASCAPSTRITIDPERRDELIEALRDNDMDRFNEILSGDE